MAAFAETLDAEWTKEEIPKATFHYTPFNQFQNGQLTSHPPKSFRSGDIFEVIQTLYLDDGAFIFGTREDMTEGLQLVYDHFARFGLDMHIGRGETQSKTECVFFPPPNFFTNTESTPLELGTEETEEYGEETDGIRGNSMNLRRREQHVKMWPMTT